MSLRVWNRLSVADHHEALRRWARGTFGVEAAVELLIRGFGGRFAEPGNAWIHTDGPIAWVDFPAISDGVGPLSGGERRYLLITTSIAGITVPLNMAEIAYLDNDLVELILRGLAHAHGTGPAFDRLHNATRGTW